MPIIELKGGKTATDRRLDRIPQFDPQSRRYLIGSVVVKDDPLAEKYIKSRSWAINVWLDQGKEGRCVEFGICHDLAALPKVVAQPLIDQILEGKLIYWPAQREDAWPGGSYEGADPHYEGTSVLAGVKVARRLGVYGEYRWSLNLEGALLGLGWVGPLILGVNWYSDMGDTDDNGYLHASGEVQGGHCILAHRFRAVWKTRPPAGATAAEAVAEYLDHDRSWIGLHNSWGPNWGVNGRAKISVRDFDQLRREEGEVCIITERVRPKALILAVAEAAEEAATDAR